MIKHIEVSEETEGPHKGQPVIKLYPEKAQLQNVLDVFTAVFHYGASLTQLSQSISKGIENLKKVKK